MSCTQHATRRFEFVLARFVCQSGLGPRVWVSAQTRINSSGRSRRTRQNVIRGAVEVVDGLHCRRFFRQQHGQRPAERFDVMPVRRQVLHDPTCQRHLAHLALRGPALSAVDPQQSPSTTTKCRRRRNIANSPTRSLGAKPRWWSPATPSPLYDELYDGGYSVALPAFTGQAGTRGDRTEVLWSNRPLAGVEEGLFDTASEFRYADGDDDAACNETSKCVVCGGVMQRAATGRRKRFCSGACRVRAHRRDQQNGTMSRPGQVA